MDKENTRIFNSTPYALYVPCAVRAEGCRIVDENGKEYLDFESGVWCANLGHNDPVVNEALMKGLGGVLHAGYGYSHEILETAAESLLKTLGMPDGRCVFLSSGSEAVEFAVQAARFVMPHPGFLGLDGYYLAAYGSAKARDAREWRSIRVDTSISDIPFGGAGAFVFEAGNASGTVRLPSQDFVSEVVSGIRARNGILVANEVTAGMGRTGRWFGFEHYGLRPDIVACGKGLGNGYPVSAVAMSREVAEKLGRTDFRYAQSHQNDPLGGRVAEAVLKRMEEKRLVERSAEVGAYFLAALQGLADGHECLQEARGRGLMCVLQFWAGDGLLPMVHRKLVEAGFFTGINAAANVLRFYPPLTVEKKMIDALIAALDGILSESVPC